MLLTVVVLLPRTGTLASASPPLDEPLPLTDWGLPYFYGQSAWPTVHRDASNSDFAPVVAPATPQERWAQFDGISMLAPVIIGPEGNRYVLTGQGQGTSHLHALDRAGNVLWESAPQLDDDHLDSWVVASAPVVDHAGTLFVGDGNQFWAFNPDGSVRWVTPIPPPGGPFISGIITQAGWVGGVTVHGQLVLLQRTDGALAMPIFELPGGSGPAPLEPPNGLWAGGLLDPALVAGLYNLFIGRQWEVTNTPAVHPASGRLYIVAAGSTPEVGVLYGIDVGTGGATIAFDSPLVGGSGTSPAISPDGRQVYVVDGERTLLAFDAETGEELWRTSGAARAASPAIALDGTILSAGGTLTAIDPLDGAVEWEQTFGDLAASMLPAVTPVPGVLPSGEPAAATNSVVSVSATQIWVALSLGYFVVAPPNGNLLLQPRITGLASVDPVDGSLRQFTPLRDSSDGVITIGADGQLYVTHGAVPSSVAYFGVNPLLPPELQLPGPPIAGLTALEPLSYRHYVAQGVMWSREQSTIALSVLLGDSASALRATKRGRVQLLSTFLPLREALLRGELDLATTLAVQAELREARDAITVARVLLAPPDPPLGRRLLATSYLQRASDALAEALTLLELP